MNVTETRHQPDSDKEVDAGVFFHNRARQSGFTNLFDWFISRQETDDLPGLLFACHAHVTELIDEIKQADTVLLGLPLYNFGPPSTVKAWVDHIIATGLSIDAETHTGLLGDTDFIVLASRGGGYGPGTPREGWDHAQIWLPHALSVTGLQPRFITAELTTADANPKMSHLKPLAAESLNKALAAIDQLWTADEDAA